MALSPDMRKLVAYDKNLLKLEKKVGKKEVIYMKVPPSDVYLSFTA